MSKSNNKKPLEKWNESHVSFSSLKKFGQSPAHFIAHKKKVFEPTDTMIVGQAIHALILEPETVKKGFAVYEGKTRRGKEWDAFLETVKTGQTIIRQKDFDNCQRVAERIRKIPVVSDLLDAMTWTERKIEWIDAETGVKIVGFVDGGGDDWFMDMKTGADTDPEKFGRNAYDQQLMLQAALYYDGLAANGIDMNEMFILRVGTTEPFESIVYQPDPNFIAYGHAMKRRLLQSFAEWDGHAHGREYHSGNVIETLSLPKWKKYEPLFEPVDAMKNAIQNGSIEFGE